MKRPFDRQSLLSLFALVTGSVAAFLMFAQVSPARQSLLEQARRFEAFPVEKRIQVRDAQAEFSGLTPERREELVVLHDQVRDDENLQKRLTMFQQWWNNRSTSEWVELSDKIRAGDSRTISGRIFDDYQARDQIIVRFGIGRPNRQRSNPRMLDEERSSSGNSRLPALVLSVTDYNKLVEVAFPDTMFDAAEQQELKSLNSESDHALLKALLVMSKLSAADGPSHAYEVMDPLIQSLRNDVPDSEWRGRFEEMYVAADAADQRREGMFRFSRNLMALSAMAVLDQGILDLGGRLSDRLSGDDEQLIATFAALEDASQRRDMLTLPPEAARERLKQLAAANPDVPQTPEHAVIARKFKYEETLALILGRFVPGPGPLGGGPDGRPRLPPNARDGEGRRGPENRGPENRGPENRGPDIRGTGPDRPGADRPGPDRRGSDN